MIQTQTNPSNQGRRSEPMGETKKIENYIYCLSSQVGRGNFSNVFKGIDQNNGLPVAIKVIKYTSITSKISEILLKNEIMILQSLNHNNIIRCYDVFTSKNNCYIVTDYYSKGDLEKLIFRKNYLEEKNIRKIIYGIYKGLLYLNSQKIVHRDIKPANIFLDENDCPKIADFGFAVRSEKSFKDMSIGSPIYMSPEGLLDQEYGPKTEVWSFGIMIYEMLHGETPLSSCTSEKELKIKILEEVTFKDCIPKDLKEMMLLCLKIKVDERIDMKEIAQTPYMKGVLEEFEVQSKDLYSTNHSSNSIANQSIELVNKAKNYEQALALLQYCRLIHKSCEESSSQICSQWLLNICKSLSQKKLESGEKDKNDNLIDTLRKYLKKYEQEHTDNHLDVSLEDILAECIEAKKKNSLKPVYSHYDVLLKETQVLQKLNVEPDLAEYVKVSQIEKYLEIIQKIRSTNSKIV